MSASLNVVKIAAVCWASTRRWAIFWRIPDIRFRVSRGSPELTCSARCRPEVLGSQEQAAAGSPAGWRDERGRPPW